MPALLVAATKAKAYLQQHGQLWGHPHTVEVITFPQNWLAEYVGKFPSGDKSVIEYPPCLLPAATMGTVGPPPYCASFHLCIPHHLALPNERGDSGVKNHTIVSGTWLCPSVNAAGSPRHALHLPQHFALVCRGCVVVLVTKDPALPAAATSPAPWRLTSLINPPRSCYLVSL